MCVGSSFHSLGPTTGKAWSPQLIRAGQWTPMNARGHPFYSLWYDPAEFHTRDLPVSWLHCSDNHCHCIIVPCVQHHLYSRKHANIPHPILVRTGTNTYGAQLPARKALVCWFGQKAERTIVGKILCQCVQIFPFSLPA